MRIAVAGADKTGLILAVCLAEAGHHVICFDSNIEKVNILEKGISPIYEPGLESLLEKNLSSRNLQFTTDPANAFSEVQIIFIAVETPEKQDGSPDLSYIYAACYTIADHMENNLIVCLKSKVPVGTANEVKQIIDIRRPSHLQVNVSVNPYFHREGSAIMDFFLNDRIVVGTDNPEAASIMEQLFLPLKIPIFFTDIKNAEMIQYASYRFYETKMSFLNEMTHLCEKVGANFKEVAYGIGMDYQSGRKS
nr:nucleotide sugar dehydrogenase [Neobacillus sp. Marseille-Q6967]